MRNLIYIFEGQGSIMKQISNQTLIQNYLSESRFHTYFSFDIAQSICLFEYNSGDFIIRESFVPQYLYFMVEGSAKLYLTHNNGKISLINFLEAPCFIGEMELFGAQTEANAIQAITPCYCLALPILEYRDVLLNDTIFLRHLCTFLSNKAIVNTSNYTKNQAFPLENRLAAFILATSNNSTYSEKHTEVSEYLGITYRHLLYVLADFVKKGVLNKDVSGYKIVDKNHLQKLANEMIS